MVALCETRVMDPYRKEREMPLNFGWSAPLDAQKTG